jgi:hypothetical protein
MSEKEDFHATFMKGLGPNESNGSNPNTKQGHEGFGQWNHGSSL